MGIQKDLGFVLKTFDLRQTSRVATIYTKYFGKITGLFKGYYTHPDYFITTLNNFSLNEFIFYEKPDELWLVSQAFLIDDFSLFNQDVSRNFTANYIVEFVNKAIELQKPNPDIFDLIYDSLLKLKDSSFEKVYFIFKIKFVSLLGLMPMMDICSQCHRWDENLLVFNVQSGGLLCPKCIKDSGFNIRVTPELVKVMIFIQKNTFTQSLRLNATEKTKTQIDFLMNRFIDYHLEIKLKADSLVR